MIVDQTVPILQFKYFLFICGVNSTSERGQRWEIILIAYLLKDCYLELDVNPRLALFPSASIVYFFELLFDTPRIEDARMSILEE